MSQKIQEHTDLFGNLLSANDFAEGRLDGRGRDITGSLGLGASAGAGLALLALNAVDESASHNDRVAAAAAGGIVGMLLGAIAASD